MSPTIYLLVILGLIIGYIYSRIKSGTWSPDLDDVIGNVFGGAVVGFIVGVIVWFIVGLYFHPGPIEYENSKRELVALKDGYGENGHFFLGSGSFSGDLKYYGYEDLGDSKYRMVKFSNSSIIVEDVDEGENPYFIEIRKKIDPNDIAWKYKKWFMGPFELDDHERWEIHIPAGSILKSQYELDLE